MKKIQNNSHFKRLVKDKEFVVKFTKKTTGKNRIIRGTTSFEYVTENSDWRPSGSDKITPDNIVKLWDIRDKGWKSIDVSTIIKLKIKA